MNDFTTRAFTTAHDAACLSEVTEAIFKEVQGRRSAQIIGDAHHPKSVASQIYFSADIDQKPGSFYVIDINKDNTLEVSCVIKHQLGGQAVAIKPESYDLTGKSVNKIVDYVRQEIDRVTPETHMPKAPAYPRQTQVCP